MRYKGCVQSCTYTTICLYCRYTTMLAIISAIPIPIQMFTASCINLYTHAHHVPHTEHKVRNGEARSAVETMQCCPDIVFYFLFVLHSAGVGRTGTFITIDNVLEQVSREGMVDISGTVIKIRQQRMKMVQTVVRM